MLSYSLQETTEFSAQKTIFNIFFIYLVFPGIEALDRGRSTKSSLEDFFFRRDVDGKSTLMLEGGSGDADGASGRREEVVAVEGLVDLSVVTIDSESSSGFLLKDTLQKK